MQDSIFVLQIKKGVFGIVSEQGQTSAFQARAE